MVRMPPASTGGGPPVVVTGSAAGCGAGWAVGCRAMNAVYGRINANRKVRSGTVVIPDLLQPEQPLLVTMGDPLPVRRADRKVLQKRARLRHRSVRMIDREHDPLDADLEQQVVKRRREIEAAEGVVD